MCWGSGVAILLRNGINFDVVNTIPTSKATSNEQLTITIQTTTWTLYISTVYCPKREHSREIIEGFCLGGTTSYLQVTLTANMRVLETKPEPHRWCSAKGDHRRHEPDAYKWQHTNPCDTTNDKDILDLVFISPPIIPHFGEFWVGEDLGSDHNTFIGVFSQTPIIDELPTQTVMLYHKAEWKDNQKLWTNHTLDIHTSTIQDIDNYVNSQTDTITNDRW